MAPRTAISIQSQRGKRSVDAVDSGMGAIVKWKSGQNGGQHDGQEIIKGGHQASPVVGSRDDDGGETDGDRSGNQ